ncbi:hypothetical protein [Microbacterium capsulatum]|uniref:LGFP repeat-containing protein n=1 Tax=Microbacterium capsulatum TaxID=3041921 RepID=A0ABU0XJR8_9MICO|nr:hypothetical protein [Microbacterium sp. ASV81]MDQ4215378.1 hypothetical protein [Microbacterium sp. ASV81]
MTRGTPEARGAFGALMLALALVVGVLVPVVGSAPAASAASASDWNAGYIIDDAVFYDSNAMTATDVQTFLNAVQSGCASGYTCLNGYGQSTPNVAADRYCNGYSGAGYQTAAQIIDIVARSCGISQRVILTLLQKEQGLVTSSAPTQWNWSAAMGQGCPDTAACDSSVAGFFYQVYYGARQFQVYRLNPNSFGYQAGRVNNILYNPEASCGTASVYIQNQATAGLYIYTPYTPNAAALANLYGTGDACSAYGNRNFWRIFTDWFGNPQRYTVLDGFASYYSAHGGATGPIGQPISFGVYVTQNGQGWYQRFSGGNLYGSYQGGTAFIPNGSALTEYNRQNGPYGSMGWPSSEQTCDASGRCVQSFVSAMMSSTSTYGAHVLWGGVKDYWLQSGGNAGPLGAALNDMVYSTPAAGAAWVQNFQAGVLVQTGAGFQLIPYSPTQDVWSASGSGAGPLGWPVSAYSCDASGCLQRFTGGAITSTSTYGAHAITGPFAQAWSASGGMTGFGAALNDAVTLSTGGGGAVQNYAAGIVTSTSAGTFLVPYGSIQAMWSAAGGQSGTYGWPLGAAQCAGGTSCAMSFQGGVISSSTWGVFPTFGSLAGAWVAGGGVKGYGVAINAIRFGSPSGGGWIQHYMTGVLTQQVGGQPVYSAYGPILDTWYHYGAENTWLGWPSSAAVCTANGCTQQFQHGVARSNAGGVSFTTT